MKENIIWICGMCVFVCDIKFSVEHFFLKAILFCVMVNVKYEATYYASLFG